MAYTLPPGHFLSLPRPDVAHPRAVTDTSTLAAHDFDVDVRTGFMPPQPPPASLPHQWHAWEAALSDAVAQRFKLGDAPGLADRDRRQSEDWRRRVREMPVLSTEELLTSEVMLRRAHHVLTALLHIYIHTLPPAPDAASPVHIPPPISVPLLRVSSSLALPPILTYSDNVLYNWALTVPQAPSSYTIEPSHLRSQTTFTGTASEEHFYLTSARIELAGVAALAILRSSLDEAFVGDQLALRRLAVYLQQLAGVIDGMTAILKTMRDGCDPHVFYHVIRPWLRGPSAPGSWVFDGAEAAGFAQPADISGPSAAQSSIIHALDIFLGIDLYSHSHVPGGGTPPSASDAARGPSPSSSSSSPAEKGTPFLKRMESYMPRHHRAFLNHLKAVPRPVRDMATAADDGRAPPEERVTRRALRDAYNASVLAVKRFRDAHIRITALYVISQKKRAADSTALVLGSGGAGADGADGGGRGGSAPRAGDQGTGGTDLMPFLKGVRDKTAAAMLQ